MTVFRFHVLSLLLLLGACAEDTDPQAIPNFASPEPGIHTSGQPSEAQFAALPSHGITRVIQLRLADEDGTGWEEERAGELGIDFVRIPVAGAEGLTRENVDRLAAELERAAGSDVLICCGSSNRVGAMLALEAYWHDGADPEEAIALGKAAGMTRLEPTLRAMLE